jgi:dTMP kinase
MNKYIALEGIDGVGKSTLARTLKEEFLKNKIPVILFEEIEDKYSGFNLLKTFIKKTNINSSLFFYLSSSIYKSQIISELLKKFWVISDRSIYSTLVYHTNKKAKFDCLNLDSLPIIWPDYCFLITIPEKIRLERIKDRKENQKSDLIKKRRGSSLWQKEQAFLSYGPIVIENSGKIENTISKIMSILKNDLKN